MIASPDFPSARPPRRVLLIDDDPIVHRQLARMLPADLTVDAALTAQDGRRLATAGPYDAIILDLTLPDGDGIDVLRAVRERGVDAPVIVLTSRGGDEDVVRGLDAGADDYVRKPVPGALLAARLRAVMRRAPRTPAELCVGDLVMHRLARRVVVAGAEIALTPMEFALLEYFLLHAGRALTRAELLREVWRVQVAGSNIVDAHVARLRSKLAVSRAAPRIVTVRGVGFQLLFDRPR